MFDIPKQNPFSVFFFVAPLKILIPLLSFLSSPLFLPNEKTTHLGSNWKAKLIKPTTTNTTTTTTKVAVLVVAPHSSSSSILHHHHHHLFFDLKLLSSLHLHLLLDLHAYKLHSFHYLFQKKFKNKINSNIL